MLRHHGGERAAGGIARDCDAIAIDLQCVRFGPDPVEGRERVLNGERITVLRRETVVDRHDGPARARREAAADRIMRLHAADDEATAVEIQQQRPWRMRLGAVYAQTLAA